MDISLSYVRHVKGDASSRRVGEEFRSAQLKHGHAKEPEDNEQSEHGERRFFALGDGEWHDVKEGEETSRVSRRGSAAQNRKRDAHA